MKDRNRTFFVSVALSVLRSDSLRGGTLQGQRGRGKRKREGGEGGERGEERVSESIQAVPRTILELPSVSAFKATHPVM